MIRPEPSKYQCPKCGRRQMIRPQSDVVDLGGVLKTYCAKCKVDMEKQPLNMFERLWFLMRYSR